MSQTLNDHEAVTPEETETPLTQRLVHQFGGGWIFVLLVGLVVTFSVLRPAQFASPFNLSTLAIDAAILLVLAIGQTYVIITGGIDLSVGSVLVFSSVASAQVMLAMSGAPGGTYGTTSGGWGIIAVGAVVAVLAGALWGLLNGLLVAVARIPALIVTLGTLGMALGTAQILSGGQDVRAVPELLVTHIGSGRVAGLPVLVLIAVAVALVAGVVLHLTRFGTWTFAVGSSSETARRSGIPLRSQIIKVYLLSGTLAGLGGMMSIARFATTTIGGYTQANLTTIAAVVLGGTSLFGGTGSIIGTVIGVFIPIVLLNGFVILGIPPFYQTVAIGAVLVLAVYVDQLKRRARTLT